MIAEITILVLIALCVVLLAMYMSGKKRSAEKMVEMTASLTREEERKMSELRAQYEGKLEDLRKLNETYRSAMEKEKKEIEIENGRLRQKIEFYEQEKERLENESEARFKNLANDILEVNSRKFKEQNESRLSEILLPFKDDLEKLRNTVKETYDTEARERFSLQERIKELMELNRTIGSEAKGLTEALKGNSKIQGDWGEMILETILEKSGLKKDVHFRVQVTADEQGSALRNDQGNLLRPDVIINYPDGRCVVIDSKVSLTAYVNMVNADGEAREEYARQHLGSVRKHIRELSEKSYQDFVGDKKTDFVMMFMPNESAYMCAMNLDSNLWQEAYDRRVLLISPTHLISVVRLVEQLWRQDDIKRNVMNIAEESGRMYDKFVGFMEDMAKIEKSLDGTRSYFDAAMKKLSTGTGNLVTRAEKIRKMGAKTQKRLSASLTENDETEQDKS